MCFVMCLLNTWKDNNRFFIGTYHKCYERSYSLSLISECYQILLLYKSITYVSTKKERIISSYLIRVFSGKGSNFDFVYRLFPFTLSFFHTPLPFSYQILLILLSRYIHPPIFTQSPPSPPLWSSYNSLSPGWKLLSLCPLLVSFTPAVCSQAGNLGGPFSFAFLSFILFLPFSDKLGRHRKDKKLCFHRIPIDIVHSMENWRWGIQGSKNLLNSLRLEMMVAWTKVTAVEVVRSDQVWGRLWRVVKFYRKIRCVWVKQVVFLQILN